jgi:hypothetical protein
MKVMINRNENDEDMINIYTITALGAYILWGVVHSDMADALGITMDDLDNLDREIVIK